MFMVTLFDKGVKFTGKQIIPECVLPTLQLKSINEPIRYRGTMVALIKRTINKSGNSMASDYAFKKGPI